MKHSVSTNRLKFLQSLSEADQMHAALLQKMQLPPWSPDRQSRAEAITAMQANTMRLDPNLPKKVRRGCKEKFAQMNYDVTVSTWTLVNYRVNSQLAKQEKQPAADEPKQEKQPAADEPLIRVVLKELFPALEGARELKRSCEYDLQVLFETERYDRVIVVCSGMNKGEMVKLVDGQVHAYPGEFSGPLTIVGLCVSLIYQRSCCLACGKEDTGDSRLLRCGRCWKTLRAPVWYCGPECQAADYYPRHKRECGKLC